MSNALTAINAASAALNLLAQYNISEQKLIDMRAAKNGEPFTAEDLAHLSADAQAAIDSIQG
jgi:hypothetical protein